MAELSALITSFLKSIWKYRWHAVIVSWIVAIIGWITVYRMPDDYQASARVYVDTQSILRPLLSGMTSVPNLDQQVAFMRRTLISRPNVEKVIRMVDLDIKSKTPAQHEELVDELMGNITITGTDRDDIYTIAYSNPDPKLGKDVVQSLLTIFVEGSFGSKRQDSEKAIEFIDDQIKTYETKLATAENALKDFKIKNMGLLPREGGFSGQMSGVTDQLSQARLELSEAEQARNAIARQVAANSGGAVTGGGRMVPIENPELDARIFNLQKNLDQLRMQYTEAHPDIVAAKRLLVQLEAKKAEEATRTRRASDPVAPVSPMMQQLKVQLATEEARVASLRARVNEYASRSERLKSQSAVAPEVEAQLAQLNRDYEVNKDNYTKLVERREAARLSGDLSATTDVLTFRVIDPPTVPLLPSGPKRLQFSSIVFVLALAVGLGIAFLMSQLRPTFMSQGTLRETTGVPVLGSISMNWTPEQKVKRRSRLYAFSAAVALLFGVYAVMTAVLIVPAL
ncbi:MAG TPA: XrtA system polysaccharide chain length determinant [Telluria sp.]